MVHGFVKQSGGHTRIYSEVGLGTSIRIYLPRADESTNDGPVVAGQEIGKRGDEVILVVEDNDGLRDVAMRRLRELGYRTVPARDGAEGLEILRGGVHFDLLFTDVVMPGGMDGRALAVAARHMHPDLKVLFTSGFTPTAASAVMADDFGVNLLTKPYRKDDLGRVVRAALDGAT